MWLSAIHRVITYDRRCGIKPSDALLSLSVRTAVELSDRTGTIGVRDQEQIASLAELFAVHPGIIDIVWVGAVAEARQHRRRIEAKALQKWGEGSKATLSLGWRVEAQDLSAALNLTKARKLGIFAGTRTIIDGKIIVGKRYSTGLPTYDPLGSQAPVDRNAIIAAYTIAKDERRVLIDRLGFKADTIRRNRRTLSEGEFWGRVLKRHLELLPDEQLAGRKREGESDWHASVRIRREAPKTRKRKPGVTDARRRYAAAHGIGLTKAKTITKGMSAEAILDMIHQRTATIAPHFVTPATRYGCNARPDKKGVNPAFSHDFGLYHPSEHEQRYKAQNHPVTELSDLDRDILAEWYLCARGKVLTAGNVRQWRLRKKLDANLFEACEFVAKDPENHPKRVAHADMRIASYRQRLEAERHADRIDGALSGKLSEITKAA